jgi:hypothetical protein
MTCEYHSTIPHLRFSFSIDTIVKKKSKFVKIKNKRLFIFEMNESNVEI